LRALARALRALTDPRPKAFSEVLPAYHNTGVQFGSAK